MRRRLLIGAVSILLVLVAMRWISAPRFDSKVLGQLTGRLYHLKRDSELLNLYTCEADLSGERLIYSHCGQDEDNENVTGFYYDQAEDLVYFKAMRANEWTLFCIDPDGGEATPLRKAEASDEAFFRDNYIKPETGGLKAFNRRGSLYLLENDQERLLRKYSGLYAPDLLPGYYPPVQFLSRRGIPCLRTSPAHVHYGPLDRQSQQIRRRRDHTVGEPSAVGNLPDASLRTPMTLGRRRNTWVFSTHTGLPPQPWGYIGAPSMCLSEYTGVSPRT